MTEAPFIMVMGMGSLLLYTVVCNFTLLGGRSQFIKVQRYL